MSAVSDLIHKGGIIAYPTEAVFGLGCDPFNREAVLRLYKIKQRPLDKAVILIASDWQQIKDLTLPIAEERLELIKQSWPGAITWLFPASEKVPHWLRGDTDKIALRITGHPVAKQLCDDCGHALVSTSANISSQPACRSQDEVEKIFKTSIDQIIPGTIGGSENPTEIFDAISGEKIR